jgi:hypothetical protein
MNLMKLLARKSPHFWLCYARWIREIDTVLDSSDIAILSEVSDVELSPRRALWRA